MATPFIIPDSICAAFFCERVKCFDRPASGKLNVCGVAEDVLTVWNAADFCVVGRTPVSAGDDERPADTLTHGIKKGLQARVDAVLWKLAATMASKLVAGEVFREKTFGGNLLLRLAHVGRSRRKVICNATSKSAGKIVLTVAEKGVVL